MQPSPIEDYMHPADDQSSMEMGYQDQGYTGTDISTPGSLPFQSPMMDVIGGIKVIPSDSNSSRKRIGVACSRCRKRKVRCSGGPTDDREDRRCESCIQAGVRCEDCLFVRVTAQIVPWPFTPAEAMRTGQATPAPIPEEPPLPLPYQDLNYPGTVPRQLRLPSMGSSPFDQSPSFGAASHQFRLPSVSELHPGFVPPAPCHGEMQQLFLTSGRPPPFHWPVPANDSSGPRSASSSSMSFRDNYITDYSNDASQDIAGSNSAYQLSGGSLSVSENDRLLGDMQYGNCYCPFPPANGRQPSQDFLGSFTAPESLYSTNAFAPTSTEEYPCPLDSSFARPSHLISNDQTPISNNSPYQPLLASPSAISIEETLAALDMLRNGGTSGKSSFSGDAAAAAAAAIPTTTAGPILHPQRNHPRTDASWGSIAVPVSLPIRKSVSRRYEPAHSAVSPGQYRRGSATPSVSAAAAAARFGGLGGHGHGETHVLPFRRNSSLFLSRDGSGVMGTEGKARKSMSRGPTEDDYPMFFGLACSGRSSLGSLFRESDTAAAAAAGVGGDHGGGGGEGGERRGSKRARCGE